MKQEWFSVSELNDHRLPGLAGTVRGIAKAAKSGGWAERTTIAGDPLCRRRSGRGGGVEYHYTVLPKVTQFALIAKEQKPAKPQKSHFGRDDAWAFYEGLNDRKKAKAQDRLEVLQKVQLLERGGSTKNQAVALIAMQTSNSTRSIYGWFKQVAGIDPADWLPYLAPRNAGSQKKVESSEDAWDMLKADWLREERPSFESCYRRLERAAEKQGWVISGERTYRRRMDAEVPKPVQKLSRYGQQALKQMFPAQERDRSIFHALEAVNADGHKWDVWVEWPDGDVIRPCMTAIQDIYSGMMLGWRIDKSENKEAFRLAFGDVVDEFGIPEEITLDNGRNFASKWLTGGTKNRYRWKYREEEPTGIITSLGIKIHWTTPFSGQSKPIERAFRDFCDNIAKHPALAGCWAGNSPVNKPEYKPKSVPLEEFIEIVEDGIVEHNQRTGRRTRTANGRSLAETFRTSYHNAPIRKATDEQRRMWLLAAEGVTVAKRDSVIKFMGNRYHVADLYQVAGQKVIARFDPQNLFSGLHVYRLDGSYLCFADIIEAAGFSDVNAARSHNLNRRHWMKAVKDAKDAHVKLTGKEVAALIPKMTEAPEMESKVVQMLPAQDELMQADPVAPGPELTQAQKNTEAELISFADRKDAVSKEQTKQDRFEKALKVWLALEGDEPVQHDELEHFKRYSQTAEWKARFLIWQDENATISG